AIGQFSQSLGFFLRIQTFFNAKSRMNILLIWRVSVMMHGPPNFLAATQWLSKAPGTRVSVIVNNCTIPICIQHNEYVVSIGCGSAFQNLVQNLLIAFSPWNQRRVGQFLDMGETCVDPLFQYVFDGAWA